jgi:hypothetical protein
MKSSLTTVRKINEAIWKNINNRGGYIYAEVPGQPEPVRITRARSVQGVLQVKTLGDGRWVPPFRVWQEQGEHHEARVICESCRQVIDPGALKVHTCPPLRVGEHFQKMMDSLLIEGDNN